MKRTFVLVAAAVVSVSASTLSVYQDRSIYSYLPTSNFIGFGKNITAKCEGESVPLKIMSECPSSERLCSELYTKIEAVETKLHENRLDSEILDKLVTLPQPNSFDAKRAIVSAQAVAKEQTRLFVEKEKLTQLIKSLKADLSKQTRASVPVGLKNPCKGTLRLEIPYGYITFKTEYTASLISNSQIEVKQYLSIRNRSGIDIEAQQASFFHRPSIQYLRPVHFRPWIVRERQPFPKKRMLQKTMLANDMETAVATPVPAEPLKAQYERSREYTVKNLKLPSDGLKKKLPVMQWQVPAECQTELYAYRNRHAYKVCSFRPKFQIEQHRWRVYQNGSIINEKASGEYAGERYKLYISNDEDIEVQRKPVVDKEKESGIFGGTIRKKDGFELTITNKSEKPKKVLVTERIPTSATDKIEVRLLSVTGNSYRLLKDGKIEMEISLPPKSHKRIEVLFEIAYDKNLKITY